MVRITVWQMVRTMARRNPRSRCRQLRGWQGGGEHSREFATPSSATGTISPPPQGPCLTSWGRVRRSGRNDAAKLVLRFGRETERKPNSRKRPSRSCRAPGSNQGADG